MQNICDFSLEEMEQIVEKMGYPKFRATQIFEGVFRGKSFSEIPNLPIEIKLALQDEYYSKGAVILDKRISNDGTIKFINKLNDNNIVESVLMKYKYGYTLCISSQVGCKMGCTFCASGKDGFVRHLSSGEMLAQVIEANKFLEGGLSEKRKITNIVMMGSGEPLDNFDNVVKFLKQVSFKKGLHISLRNISVSTCGIVPKIKELANMNLPITLSISLHATTDEIRKKIMPIARVYSIAKILDACEYYFDKTKRRIVFEYTVVNEVNNDESSVRDLKKISSRFPCHINIIALNEAGKSTAENELNRTYAVRFLKMLQNLNISATLRRTMGIDIEGACGQLKRSYLNDGGE